MRYISILLSALGLALAACGGARGGKPSSEAAGSPAAEPEPVQPVLYRHRVVAEYPHPADNYTQGLVYFGGLLWGGHRTVGRVAPYDHRHRRLGSHRDARIAAAFGVRRGA